MTQILDPAYGGRNLLSQLKKMAKDISHDDLIKLASAARKTGIIQQYFREEKKKDAHVHVTSTTLGKLKEHSA